MGKMTDFMGKIDEAVIQVRQAMSLQDKKIMEMIMTKILDERVRDGKNAEMLDALKDEVAQEVQNRFSTAINGIAESLDKEKKSRKSDFEKLSARCRVFESGGGGLHASRASVPLSAAPKPPPPPIPDNLFTVEGFAIVNTNKPRDSFDVTWDFSHSGSDSLPINQVGVCPVGVGPGPTPPPMPFAAPVVQQVLRNIVAPKFTGRAQDWPQFSFDWNRYLTKIAMGKEIENALLLELWESVLDETNQKFLRMRQLEKSETGGQLSYNEEFERVESKYSRDQNIGARKKWEEVVIFTPQSHHP